MGHKPKVLKRDIRKRILRFYDQHKRDLPWRRTSDPYAIWISEIMLQQTRVSTVIPYWTRWLEKFPTVAALATAQEDSVLSAWSGLGYYSRARNLQKGAQEILADYDGSLPSSSSDLQRLSGIGPYTAGAISSIAFAKEAPIVDGNVERILCRIFGIRSNPRETITKKKLWNLAAELVVGERPGDFNQGMMELGATLCSPKSPQCSVCPVESSCIAYNKNLIERLPALPKRKSSQQLPVVSLYALLFRRDDQVALCQRPTGGLYEKLWELPNVTQRDKLCSLVKGTNPLGQKLGTHTQVLSHRRLRFTLYAATIAGSLPTMTSTGAPLRWFSKKQRNTVGISTATTSLLQKVETL